MIQMCNFLFFSYICFLKFQGFLGKEQTVVFQLVHTGCFFFAITVCEFVAAVGVVVGCVASQQGFLFTYQLGPFLFGVCMFSLWVFPLHTLASSCNFKTTARDLNSLSKHSVGVCMHCGFGCVLRLRFPFRAFLNVIVLTKAVTKLYKNY